MRLFRITRDPSASPRRRRRVRAGDVIIILALAVLATALVTLGPREAVNLLYNPIAGLILLVMIVEFLWLKSGDRTRVYRLEIERLRTLRRRDEDMLQRARSVLGQALDAPPEDSPLQSPEWRRRATELRKDLEERF